MPLSDQTVAWMFMAIVLVAGMGFASVYGMARLFLTGRGMFEARTEEEKDKFGEWRRGGRA